MQFFRSKQPDNFDALTQLLLDGFSSEVLKRGLVQDSRELDRIIGRFKNSQGLQQFFPSIVREVLSRVLKLDVRGTKDSLFWSIFKTEEKHTGTVALYLLKINDVPSVHYEYAWEIFYNEIIYTRSKSPTVDYINDLASKVVEITKFFEKQYPGKQLDSTLPLNLTKKVLDRSRDPTNDFEILLHYYERTGHHANIQHLEIIYGNGHRFIPVECALNQQSPYKPEEVFLSDLSKLDRVPTAEMRAIYANKFKNLDDAQQNLIRNYLYLSKEFEDLIFHLEDALFLVEYADKGEAFLDRITQLIKDPTNEEAVAQVLQVIHEGVLQAAKTQDVSHLDNIISNFLSHGSTEVINVFIKESIVRHYELYPEKPIEEVVRDFLNQVQQDSVVVSEHELEEAVKIYGQIVKHGEKLINLPDTVLDNKAKALKNNDNQLSENEFAVEYFSVMREIIKRDFGIYPYNTQILTVLLLVLRGDVQSTCLLGEQAQMRGGCTQVNTGEGKSLQIAMLAGYKALKQIPVHIMTANVQLAKRDTHLYKPIFNRFGLVSDYGCFNEKHWPEGDFQILYSTNFEMISRYMHDRLVGEKFLKLGDSACGVLIVDEADSLLLDRIRESCRLMIPVQCLLDREQFQTILSFVEQNLSSALDITDSHLSALREQLAPMPHMSDLVLKEYLISGVKSFTLKEGEDYVVSDGKIVIVDRDYSGRIQMLHQWEYGLHHMVSLKHGLKLPLHMSATCSYTHPSFFAMYTEMYGLTGTLGSLTQKDELKLLYGLSTFDSPPHNPCIRIDHAAEVYKNIDDKWNRIIQILNDHPNNPVLIVCDTIRSAKLMHERLSGYGILSQLSTDFESLSERGEAMLEADLINCAGEIGRRTVTTSIFGRGVDVKLSPESLASGGLIVIQNSMSLSQREEKQVRGRAGRQGEPGMTFLLASVDEDPLFRRITPAQKDLLYSIQEHFEPASRLACFGVEFLRSLLELIEANQRFHYYRRLLMLDNLTDSYFDIINKSAEILDSKTNARAACHEIILKDLQQTWCDSLQELLIKIDSYDKFPIAGSSGQNTHVARAFAQVERILLHACEKFNISENEIPEWMKSIFDILKNQYVDFCHGLGSAEIMEEELRGAIASIKGKINDCAHQSVITRSNDTRDTMSRETLVWVDQIMSSYDPTEFNI